MAEIDAAPLRGKPLSDVRQRQIAQERFVDIREPPLGRFQRPYDVVVGVRHALRGSGGSRRVDQAHGVFRPDSSPRPLERGRVAGIRLAARSDQVVPRQHALRRLAVNQNEVPKCRRRRSDRKNLRQERLVLDEGHCRP